MVTTQARTVMEIDHQAIQAKLWNRRHATGLIEAEPSQGQPTADEACNSPSHGCNANLDNITTVLS